MKSRRGLTLLEVLGSAALLAVLAAACVPLLAAAMRDLEDVRPPFEYGELVKFVDSLLAQGSASALEADASEIPWPAIEGDRPSVRVRRMRAEPDARHAWLVFSAGPWTVCRWVEIPGDERSGQEGGSP